MRDWTRWLNVVAQARKPSAIRALQPIMRRSDVLNLGGGLPNPSAFPVTGLAVTLRDGRQLELPAADVAAAQQYSPTPGLPRLVSKLKSMVMAQHALPASTFDDAGPASPLDLIITSGSQDALCKSFEAFLSPGDSILTEDPTYSGALAALEPLGVDIVGCVTDEHGLQPEKLEHLLQSWDCSARRMPKVLYTIPTGQNPSGATLPTERRHAIYKLAQEHNLLILEDDPYYFLRLDGATDKSFLSIDTDQRVVRFDSFSKVLSSGMRLGYVTGPRPLIQALELHMQASLLHVSGVSQVLCLSVLEAWGEQGFVKHVASVQSLYRSQRDLLLGSLERHLDGLATWAVPKAGMFVWLRLSHLADSAALVQRMMHEQKVVLLPGDVFALSHGPTPYLRACYSVASAEAMDEACARLAKAIRVAMDQA